MVNLYDATESSDGGKAFDAGSVTAPNLNPSNDASLLTVKHWTGTAFSLGYLKEGSHLTCIPSYTCKSSAQTYSSSNWDRSDCDNLLVLVK